MKNNKVKKQINSDIIKSLNKPVRMCIVCRDRFPQKNLYRFQEIKGKIVNFTNRGRSFYICKNCIQTDEKKLNKILGNRLKIDYKNIADFGKILKEFGENG